MKFLQSPWLAAILGAVLFLLTSAFLTRQGLSGEGADGRGESGADFSPLASNVTGPSWEFFNPELDQLLLDLKGERESLGSRQKQLDEFAARLRAERAELDDALKNIKKIQEQVDRDVFRIQSQEESNLKRLAKL